MRVTSLTMIDQSQMTDTKSSSNQIENVPCDIVKKDRLQIHKNVKTIFLHSNGLTGDCLC